MKPRRIHFMGIGGSGMSAVAQIAKAYGYEISGCDLQSSTPYLGQLGKLGQLFVGHSPSHLKDIDLLCVSPAILYQNPDHPEYIEAKKKNIVITWQEFMGKYLHQDKFVICVAGTHGKSTTTALAGLLLENAGLDPTVEVGAVYPEWKSNFRIGKGKYFISEADEYHHNFLSYHPDIIILNNLEMDHPEYFVSQTRLLDAYQQFINQLKPTGTLIYNQDSPLISALHLPANSIPYTFSEFDSQKNPLSIPGDHNKSNALGIIKLAHLLNIPDGILQKTISSFSGLSRRLELLGEKNGIQVFDDYSNHPTSFAAAISAVKSRYPKNKITAVIEPHTFSRLRTLLPGLPTSVSQADEVIITKIFASREQDPGDFTGADIAAVIPDARYIPEFNDVVAALKKESQPGDVILVMGSGDSYKLSRQILSNL